MAEIRKKSPGSPSVTLEESIKKVFAIYDKEKRHNVPTAVVAQDLGYKDATNGAALTMLATLKMYGLLASSVRGQLAVTSEVEEYKFNPKEDIKKEILIDWLFRPKLYCELLSKYSEGLPSDSAIIHELIKQGFTEKSANVFLKVFKENIEFTGYFKYKKNDTSQKESDIGKMEEELSSNSFDINQSSSLSKRTEIVSNDLIDRIPIRLSGGRRAWLEIPMPFYAEDKEVIKRFIDVIVSDE